MAAKKTVVSPDFMYLSLESIIVEEQIRSSIDTENESFKALMESIAGTHACPRKGVAPSFTSRMNVGCPLT